MRMSFSERRPPTRWLSPLQPSSRARRRFAPTQAGPSQAQPDRLAPVQSEPSVPIALSPVTATKGSGRRSGGAGVGAARRSKRFVGELAPRPGLDHRRRRGGRGGAPLDVAAADVDDVDDDRAVGAAHARVERDAAGRRDGRHAARLQLARDAARELGVALELGRRRALGRPRRKRRGDEEGEGASTEHCREHRRGPSGRGA